MARPLPDPNVTWLVQANILRYQRILDGELTILQRQAVERLLAEQRAKLEELVRPEGSP
jgi:hypothetical protein